MNKLRKVDVDNDKKDDEGADEIRECNKSPFKVCAICCKDRALPNQNDGSGLDEKIEELTAKMEEKLGRTLKLREQKAIERKVERAKEKEKELLKEERRRAREEAEKLKGAEKKMYLGYHNDDKEECPLDPSVDEGGKDLSLSDDDVRSYEREETESEYNEDNHDFLNEIGGRGELLTGEAYQKMLLQKEKPLTE